MRRQLQEFRAFCVRMRVGDADRASLMGEGASLSRRKVVQFRASLGLQQTAPDARSVSRMLAEKRTPKSRKPRLTRTAAW